MFSRAQSRRSSFFGGGLNNQNNRQSMVGGYYRGQGQENEDYHNQPDQYDGQGQNGYGGGRYAPRMNRGLSEPMMQGGPVQPIQPPYHQYHNSRDTVTASPETDQSGQSYSTNPSSYNNSNDQLGQMGMQNGMGYPKPMGQNRAAPPQAQQPAPAPMKLNTGIDTGGDMSFQDGGKKKKSWLKRRFSKG